jgi:hypothetical protein
MRKLVLVTTFAAVALAAHSAAACEWNRQASAKAPVVATTAPATTPTEQTSQGAVPPSTSVASDENTRKTVDDPTPVVLITDRH